LNLNLDKSYQKLNANNIKKNNEILQNLNAKFIDVNAKNLKEKSKTARKCQTPNTSFTKIKQENNKANKSFLPFNSRNQLNISKFSRTSQNSFRKNQLCSTAEKFTQNNHKKAGNSVSESIHHNNISFNPQFDNNMLV